MLTAVVQPHDDNAPQSLGATDTDDLQPIAAVDVSDVIDISDANDDFLIPIHQVFVAEYLVDLSSAAAARRTGISPTNASQLLSRPDVQRAIARGKAQRASRVGITQDTVIYEVSLLGLSRVDHFVVTDEGQVTLAAGAPDGAMAAVQSIKKKVKIHSDKEGNETFREYDIELKLWDKPGSLKLLGRHVGLFPDRMEHTGKDGGPIEVSQVRSVIVDPAHDDA